MLAGAVAVAAVEDLALVQDDGVDEPVLADVGDELAELGPVHVHEREEGGGRVVLELGGWGRGLVGRWVGGSPHTRYSRERGE